MELHIIMKKLQSFVRKILGDRAITIVNILLIIVFVIIVVLVVWGIWKIRQDPDALDGNIPPVISEEKQDKNSGEDFTQDKESLESDKSTVDIEGVYENQDEESINDIDTEDDEPGSDPDTTKDSGKRRGSRSESSNSGNVSPSEVTGNQYNGTDSQGASGNTISNGSADIGNSGSPGSNHAGGGIQNIPPGDTNDNDPIIPENPNDSAPVIPESPDGGDGGDISEPVVPGSGDGAIMEDPDSGGGAQDPGEGQESGGLEDEENSGMKTEGSGN